MSDRTRVRVCGKLLGSHRIFSWRVKQQGTVSPSMWATFFMGSMRERMVLQHQKSRNIPPQIGELYFQKLSCFARTVRRL